MPQTGQFTLLTGDGANVEGVPKPCKHYSNMLFQVEITVAGTVELFGRVGTGAGWARLSPPLVGAGTNVVTINNSFGYTQVKATATLGAGESAVVYFNGRMRPFA